MTSTELRRIVGAMTERPWFSSQSRWQSDCIIAGAADVTASGDARVIVQANPNFPYRADLDAIATLANHADALVKLVEACERYVRGIDPEVFSTRAEADLHYALADALAAVNAVNAVKETP